MAAVNLAIDLKPRGIVVALLHPGMVRTGMGAGPGAIDPELSARRLVQRIDEVTLEKTGDVPARRRSRAALVRGAATAQS